MKNLMVVVFLATIFCFVKTSNASFFLTRYQNQRIEGETVHQTWNIIQFDLDSWSFGGEVGADSTDDRFKWFTPFIYHDLPLLGEDWQVGARFEHDSFSNNSLAPSIRYAKVKELWHGQNALLLFQVDYYWGDVERLELWGNITFPLFSQMPGFGWRLGIEGFFSASPEGKRNYQLRFPRLGYRLPGFWKFKVITPALMLEHQWDDRGGNETIQSTSVYCMITFNF